jgi:fructose-bisphosphate aldolase class II
MSKKIKTLKDYLKKAQKEGWAIGHFNFSTLEQLTGILNAAQKTRAPVILGTSEGESKFLGLEEAVNLVKFYQKKLPVFLHLDHGKSFGYIKKAIGSGYKSVHFDGSKLPLGKNIEVTKRIVRYAKKKNVLVEGEVGMIGTDASRLYRERFKIKEEDLTNPADASKFIKETNVDSLAISIGAFHGIEVRGLNPRLRLKRLREIKNRVGDAILVLHGGSGTPREDIKKAIKLGIVKININTELRLTYTNTLKKVLKKKPKEIVPYRYMPEVVKAVQKVVEEKIKLFGSANKA